MKANLTEAGVYDALVEETSKRFSKQANEIPGLEEETADRITRQALTVDVVQAQIESALDSTYAWLNGETAALHFSIDFSEAEGSFKEIITEEARAHLDDLPACTTAAQATQADNPWGLTCVPPGADTDQFAQAYAEELFRSGEPLGDIAISSGDIINETGASDEDSVLPKTFQWLRKAFWPLVAGVLFLSLAIIALSATKRKGVRRAGNHYLLAGALILILAGSAALFARSVFAIEQGTALQAALVDALYLLIDDAAIIAGIFGVIILLGGFIIRTIVRKKKHK